MNNFVLKIAYPIILAGLFVVSVFLGLNCQSLGPQFYVLAALLTVYVFLFGFAIGRNFGAFFEDLLQKTTQAQAEQNRAAQEELRRSLTVQVRAQTHNLEETITALEQKVKNRTTELQKLLSEMEKMKRNSPGSDA